MPISHTNRKGQTFFLRQGLTKTGKPRYFFSKTIGQDALEQIQPVITWSADTLRNACPTPSASVFAG